MDGEEKLSYDRQEFHFNDRVHIPWGTISVLSATMTELEQ
jgi:hypothetical protein